MADLGIQERGGLQCVLRDHIEVIAPGTLALQWGPITRIGWNHLYWPDTLTEEALQWGPITRIGWNIQGRKIDRARAASMGPDHEDRVELEGNF